MHQPPYATVQCVYIVCTKRQMTSVKAVIQIDFPMHKLLAIKDPYEDTMYATMPSIRKW